MDRLFDFMKEVRRITMPYGYGRNQFKALEAEEMDQVKIAESSGRMRFNEQFLIELNQLNEIKVFADMLRNADEYTGEVIHNEPDFDLEIRYKGDDLERYRLWLGRVGAPSVLMNVSQTHLVYKVPADVTDRLIRTLGVDD